MQHTRASTRTASTGDPGTSTVVDTDLSTPGGSASVERSDGVLHLRGSSSPQGRRRVTWTEGVIDNEGMNKKKTKVCCIYHKPREFGESSSDDEDSSTDSENDSDTNGPGGEPSEERGSSHRNSKGCRSHASRRKNAYEKNPVAGKDK